MHVTGRVAGQLARCAACLTLIGGCATAPPADDASGPTTASSSARPADAAAPASAAVSATPTTPRLTVVAAENVWGSIAAQLGGDRVSVSSIVVNPNADPHDYEPTPADARRIVAARLFIQNGIGYDTSWAPKLVAANPEPGRDVLTVGDVLGLKDGDNPHQWYSHDGVLKMVDAIVAEYLRLDAADSATFERNKHDFESDALVRYSELESRIRDKYRGTPIGASESIATPLADSLDLNLLTPATFLTAISEGTDPTAADKSTIDDQIKNRQIKVYLYNSQNATPDVSTQVTEAKAVGVPVCVITETPQPADATFQDWMVSELSQLEAALAQATGS
ncbi:MAG TPA: zinc ABC transporter substrate-binding protein [Sporichthyaceae bacterium]|nr:zinc ABC transporter substrate-binding protein [Sporichthyaceae bacterium]